MKKAVLILFAVILSLPCYTFSQDKEITLEQIYLKPEFTAEGPGMFRSMNDGNYYSKAGEDMSIKIYDYETGSEQRTLLSSEDYDKYLKPENIPPSGYVFSQDEKKILFTSNVQRIYRTSFVANYFVWNIDGKTLTHINHGKKASLAEFSPAGDKVALVIENNLYVYDLASGKLQQITSDGAKNKIINGAADWVYEEELGISKTFEWSPDGNYLAYLKFNESNVKTFSLTFYEGLYPNEFEYKYPKAGEDNSVVTTHIYDLKNGKTTNVNFGTNKYEYTARLKFTPDSKELSLVCLDRLQKNLAIIYADAASGQTRVVYKETDKYYLGRNYDITFLKDGRFIKFSDADGYTHLYLHDKNGNIINQVTKGNYEVSELKGVDEKAGTVYYLAFSPDAINRDVFVVNLDGSNNKQISVKPGFNNAAFSSGFKYYVTSYSDANTPGYYELHRKDGTLVKMIKDNKELTEKMKEYRFVSKDFFRFTTSENIELNGWIMKPPDFDANKKYPVLMYVYGGPGSQSVMNVFMGGDFYWYQLLCKKGYIIACVDGRGTCSRGSEFEKQIYGRMGELELKDQIEGAKYFGSLPYVDKDRIGIWGWSFGGYMSAYCITAGADYFKTAVAVAPVTNFRYYDNIYTERYLGLPSENPKGYDDNSPVTYADKMKGNLLIVHGSTDDNVHYQNTMEFINALVKANKQFEMQIYPNRNHNIGGGNTRYHLFKRITEYLLRNL
jgi:dipeptidyl-peptidase 4